MVRFSLIWGIYGGIYTTSYIPPNGDHQRGVSFSSVRIGNPLGNCVDSGICQYLLFIHLRAFALTSKIGLFQCFDKLLLFILAGERRLIFLAGTSFGIVSKQRNSVQVGNQFWYRHFRQLTPFWVNFEPFVLRRYNVSCHDVNIPINYALDVSFRFGCMLIGHVQHAKQTKRPRRNHSNPRIKRRGNGSSNSKSFILTISPCLARTYFLFLHP